ncbi:MAG: C39 family peptidase, partial [Phycisphaerae bacterium]|nr:C39 family peptidase [Phycisphaerae bacterium]
VYVNADNFTPAWAWHGVSGIVWSDTRIDSIALGDGLADDGGADVAQAAIMSTGSIGTVSIVGPYYTVTGVSNTSFQLLDGMGIQAYGEVNGSIIGRSNTTEEVTDLWGNVTTRVLDAVGLVIGTGGARLTALVLGTALDGFECFRTSSLLHSGGVGTVSFSGPLAEIERAGIYGQYVRKVSVPGADTYGISNTHIYGTNPPANEPVVGLVEAGGPGMNRVFVSVNGGSIGTVRGLGATADIYNSVFTATNGMTYIGARDLNTNGIHMPGTVGTIRGAGDVTSNIVRVGAINSVVVSGDFELNTFEVAGRFSSMTVGGAFIDSYMAMHGPSVAYLVSLVVTGDISGTFISAGKIGSIISRTGGISADISTVVNDWSGDINLIQTATGYTGTLNVAGSLNRFISGAPLGDNPDTTPDNRTQVFNIREDLGYMRVAGDLYAGINVGGDVGTMDIDGTFYSNMFVNGSMTSLIVDGGLGGILGGLGIRGTLTVLGDLKSMRFNTASDLFADLTVGGDIKRLYMRGGSIVGALTSLYGSIGYIYLNGGNITGNVQAASLGTIYVRDGDITGDITATNGNIKSISIYNGDLDTDVLAENGRIDRISITNGNATAGHTIEASGAIGTVTIRNGDLDADLISGAGIKRISITGSDLTGMVNAAGDIGSFRITGNVIGTAVRSGGQITRFYAAGLNNAIISSAWNMGTLNITGDATNSHILAGFDVGDDGIIGTADDNLLNGGLVHSGNIKSMTIRGALDGSIVAAGIDGGALGYLNLADNVEAAGQSSIVRMSVLGGFGAAPATSGVLADTSIYQRFADEAIAAGVVVDSGITTVLNGAGVDFGPDTVQGRTLTDGDLTLTLTSGRANYDPATGNLMLEETTSRSSLRLDYRGAGAYPTVINVIGSDDSGLSSFNVRGNVTLGHMFVNGGLRTLVVGDVANGSAWALPGGVTSARLAELTNVNITAGEVGAWSMTGAYNSGDFTVDSVRSFRTNGAMGGNLISLLGNVGAVYVRGGNFDGDMTVRGNVRTLFVRDDLAGNVVVNNGDLSSVRVGSLSGVVNVPDGLTRTVTISTGDFGGAADTSYRTAAGIGSFTVSRGDFSALLSTPGNLGRLSVRGEMSGRAWSGGNIRSMTVGSMNGALVAASGDLTTATVRGDMYGSYILAGFDPGDAGYDNPAGSGENANLQIDAFTILTDPTWQIAENTDYSYGGSIRSVSIGGDMGRQAVYNPDTRRYDYNYAGSTIAAGVAPGVDGYWGTGDDMVAGIGYINRVRVTGWIFGSGGADESYGVFAASEMPTVYHRRNRPFLVNGNAHVGTMQTTAGPLTVTSVQVLFNSITVYFNHPVNAATIGTVFTGMTPESFTLIASDDNVFDPLTDTVVSETVDHTLDYDSDNYSVRLMLGGGMTWNTLGAGGYYQLTLDGSVVSDNRGVLLDGEYIDAFPSGDNEAGGDFVYEFGQAVLTDVPVYWWWHGCAPTAAGMLVGYYDNTMYNDLITGDPNDQTVNLEINETIASSGDGTYTGDGTVIVSGTPGTGHIPDYALYDDYDDSGDAISYPDMSDLDPAGAHADDCLADFMYTSMSAYGGTMGSSWPTDIGPGVEDFFTYKTYTATSADLVYGIFTWDALVAEINAGRPVILGVDAGGTGAANHAIIATGYDTTTQQYFCHTTWADNPITPEDESMGWYDFTGVSPGQDYGISMAITINVA